MPFIPFTHHSWVGMLLISWIRLKAKLHEDPWVHTFSPDLQVPYASNTAFIFEVKTFSIAMLLVAE